MKKIKNKTGISLIELLVAMPMLAFVFLGMAYILATTGAFTVNEIGKVKTQIAANNVLMLIKSEGYLNLGDVLDFVTTKNASDKSKSVSVSNVTIPKDSLIHPDGETTLLLSIEEKQPDSDTTNISSKICVITVTAPGYDDIQTTVKTLSF